MTVYVSLEFGGTEGCCGVTQIKDFSTPWPHGEVKGSGKNEEEAYKALFDNLMVLDPQEDSDEWGRVLQIWFFKPRDFAGNDAGEYQAEPFRKLIETIPNVINLGEHRNPNSGNLIQGYQWEFQV
jgi:hypothetical protein